MAQLLPLRHLKLRRPLAVFDLESTGLDPSTDRIVEVAVVTVRADGESDTYHRLVDPGGPIPAEATRVHGISDADVADAPPFADIARDLHDRLAGCDLAGFGITSFDLPLLAAEFARAGVDFRVAGRRVLDALDVYRRMEPRDLAHAVRHYLGRDHPDAHSAAADARAAAEVLDRQVGRYGLPADIDALHKALVEVDVARRFRRDAGGRVVFGFGKHAGRRLADVARTDPGYLRWMLGQSFLDDVQGLVRRALVEPPPTREAQTPAGDGPDASASSTT